VTCELREKKEIGMKGNNHKSRKEIVTDIQTNIRYEYKRIKLFLLEKNVSFHCSAYYCVITGCECVCSRFQRLSLLDDEIDDS